MFSSGQGVWQAYKGSNRQRTHKEGGGFVGFLEGYCQCEQSMDMVTGMASPTHWGAECEVREVFVIHVGGTRCVPSSTDHILNIQARITLTVECIRPCIFLFLCYV